MGNTKQRTRLLPIISFVLIALAVPCIVYSLLYAKPTRAEWFNPSWGYRQAIRFTNGGSAVTDQKVLIQFATDTPITANKMQSSCQDIRFTDALGKPLQYYLNVSGGAGIGCNDASSDIYVQMPSIGAGVNLIYIYYGNPAAAAGTQSANFGSTTFSPSAGPTAASEEVTPGPVAYWKFDENQGSVAGDATGHGNALTLTRTEWATESASLSNRTTYLKFNGTTSVASRAHDTDFDFGTGSFSVSSWIRHSSTASNTDVLITKYNTAGWKVYMNSSGFICFGIDDDSSWGPDDSACSTTSYADSQWHHVEVVKSATTSITVYVDGKQVAQTTSLTATGTLSTTASLYIGADASGDTSWWDGAIDDIAIYPYARSASQVSADSGGPATAAVLGSQANDGMNNGLVGYWKMDDNTGATAIDSSGNNLTTSAFTGNVAWVGGKFGSGLDFDGTDDVVRVVETPTTDFGATTDSYSLSIWVNTDNLAANAEIFSKRTGTTYPSRFIITSTESITFEIGHGSTKSTLNSTISLTPGSWYHLAVVRDVATDSLSLYINGELNARVTDSTTQSVANNDDWSLGNGGTSYTSADFSGSLDEARLYNRALSQADVGRLYSWAPGPVGYWKMDEGSWINDCSTLTVLDSSGYGNNGVSCPSSSGSTLPVTGKVGKAGTFDGVNDYVEVNQSFKNKLRSFSVSLWTYVNTLDGSTSEQYHLVQRLNGEASYPRLRIIGNGRVSLQFSVSGVGDTITTPIANAISTNRWYHLSANYDNVSNIAKIYINGVLVISSVITPTGSLDGGSSNMRIGNAGVTATYFNGKIDDLKVYNYIRESSQVVEDMNGGHPAPGGNVGSAVGYWKMDEGADNTCEGGVNDICNIGSAGSALSGAQSTMEVPATSTSGWTMGGKFGKALAFDGTNDFVTISDSAVLDIDASQSYTWSLWVNPTTLTLNNWQTLWSQNGASNPSFFIYAMNSNDDAEWGPVTNGISAGWNDGSNAIHVHTTPNVLSAGAWSHVVVTYDGSKSLADRMNIYINGINKTDTSDIHTVGTPANISSTTTYIGRNATYGEYFPGKIDEVKLFTSLLTQDEVKTLFNQSQSIVLGALSTASDGVTVDTSASREYCVPGDTATCSPPIAHWKLDEKTGTTANDSAQYAVHGTLTSGASWATGRIGPAVRFDGVDDYIAVPYNASLDPTTDVTISFWFKPATLINSSTVTSTTGLISKANTNTDANNDWQFSWFNTQLGRMRFGTYGDYINTTTDTWLANTWYHIEVVVSGTNTANIYVNGQLDTYGGDTTIAADPINGNQDTALNIGLTKTTQGDFYFNGIIDDLKIYNYARTTSQVAWEYNRGAPVARYTFDECQGSTAYNTARNADGKAAGMNGTITIGASGTYTSAGTCGSGTSTESWNGGTTGKYGAALAVDATNDYMAIADTPALDFTTDMTVSAWVYSTVLPTTSSKDANIVNKFITATNQRSYKLIVDKADNKYYFLVDGDGSSGSTASAISDVTFTSNTWHHVVGVFQNSTAYIYVDGVLQSTSSNQGFSTIYNSTADTVIGMDANKTSAPNSGLYDDVMLFNYAVTAAQVKLLYNQGSAVRFGP
jgi:hypothetical protein